MLRGQHYREVIVSAIFPVGPGSNPIFTNKIKVVYRYCNCKDWRSSQTNSQRIYTNWDNYLSAKYSSLTSSRKEIWERMLQLKIPTQLNSQCRALGWNGEKCILFSVINHEKLNYWKRGVPRVPTLKNGM